MQSVITVGGSESSTLKTDSATHP